MTTFAGNIAQQIVEKIAEHATCGWCVILKARNPIDPATPVGVPLRVIHMAIEPSRHPVDWETEPLGWPAIVRLDVSWMRAEGANGIYLLRADADVEWVAPLSTVEFVLADALEDALDEAGVHID